MPKAINYKANSVVYFSGDFDSSVFLLKNGNIALTSIDIETGSQVTDYIKTGEFFGVKSALGKHPREETAMVLTDSLVYAFSGPEFESFAQSNTRIILQMIKVFSRQLRTVHKHLASLLDSEEETDPEEGLFTVMNAFYNSMHYKAAVEVGNRYMAMYPNGKYGGQVQQLMQTASSTTGGDFGNIESSGLGGTIEQPDKPSDADNSNVERAFKMAANYFSSGEFEEAYKHYHSVIENNAQGEILDAAYIGAGMSLYSQKEFVRCMQLLSGFISQYPKSTKIAEALMYLGLCYQAMGRAEKAISFYDKAVLLADETLAPKIKELQENCTAQLGGA